MTRTLAVMIAAGYMTDGKGNPGLDLALKLSIDDIEAAQLEDAETRQKHKAVAEPAIGSFERAMSRFGGMTAQGSAGGEEYGWSS